MKKNLLFKKPFLFLFLLLSISVSSSAQWTQKANAFKTRSEFAGVVYNSKLYGFLGFGNYALQPTVTSEVYDPPTDTWSLLASIPKSAAMTHQGVVLIDNTVWHIGGRVGDNPGPLTSDIWIYNITTDSWSQGPELRDPSTGDPLRWAAGGAVLLGRTLHVFGGFAINACNNDQGEYHLTLDVDSWLSDKSKPASWKNDLAPLPIKRNHFGSVVSGGKIYAIGGQFGHDCGGGLDEQFSHVYDPSTDRWTELPSLPSPRSHTEGSTFALDGKIYLVAGQGQNNASTNYVTVFDPEARNGKGKWKEEHSLSLPAGYEGLLAKVIGNTFIIAGGGMGRSSNPRKQTYSRTIDRNPVHKFGFSSVCLKLTANSGRSVKGETLLYTFDGNKKFVLSTNADWLTITKNATGTANPNAVDIEVRANTEGLAPGNYSATITAKGAGGGVDYEEANYCVRLVVKGTVPSEVKLEAEQANLNGVEVATNHPDYSGTGFADYINKSTDYIEWSFKNPDALSTVLRFRYSNGRETDRPLELEVNGVVINSHLSFPPTDSWTDWDVIEVPVRLKSGENTVRLTATGNSGPNVDYLEYGANNNSITSSKPLTLQNDVQVSSELLKAYVSPNPASANARLILKGASTTPVEMELTDLLGRTYQKRKFITNGSNSYNFSVNGLPAGVYMVRVKQGTTIKTTKLVVGFSTLQ